MKYLVGYDGSNVAKDALKLAFKRVKGQAETVEVVKTITQSHTLKYEDIRRQEHALDNEVKELCDDDAISYKTHLLVTHQTPGEAMIEFANDHEIEEIIIGVRRRSKVEKLVFGSTAQYIILNSPCPVLTIR